MGVQGMIPLNLWMKNCSLQSYQCSSSSWSRGCSSKGQHSQSRGPGGGCGSRSHTCLWLALGYPMQPFPEVLFPEEQSEAQDSLKPRVDWFVP